MDRKYVIKYVDEAVNDLDSIFSYISNKNIPAALSMLDEIESRILRLQMNPRLGVVLPTDNLSIVKSGYRYLVVESYIIFYRIIYETIIISRVLHSKQDWLSLIF